MTPLSSITIVLGKLKSSFVYVSIFLVSSLPVLLSLFVLEFDNQQGFSLASLLDIEQLKILLPLMWRLGVWIAILFTTTVCFVTAGFFMSSISKSTSMATTFSYCFAALTTIVTLVALIPNALPDALRVKVLTINPLVAALRVTSDEMFPDLPADIWKHNLYLFAGLSLFFIIASSIRVYFILSKRK